MKLYKEKPGIIGKRAVWVFMHEEYMYTGDTFIGLLYTVVTQWKANCNFIGF